MFLLLSGIQCFAGGSTTYYFKVNVSANPTGQGTVYVSDKSSKPESNSYQPSMSAEGSESSSQQAATKDFYLFAEPALGYAFSHWSHKNADGTTDVLSSQNTKITLTSSKSDKSNPAVFDYVANFVEKSSLDRAVSVVSGNLDLGTVSIDKTDNKIGDSVTISAQSGLLIEFEGWLKNGEGDLIKQNPYTFKVDEEAQYVAQFKEVDKGYYFIRNQGHSTFMGLIGTKDNVSRSQRALTNSVMLVSEHHQWPALVLFVSGSRDGSGGLTNASFSSQGADTYTIAQKNYFTVSQVLDNGYYLQGTVAGLTGYLVDYADAFTESTEYGKVNHPKVYNGANTNDKQYIWNFYPINESTLDNYYFGVAPAPKMFDKEEKKYWTSLYVAFPFKCMDGVKAYYVSGFNNSGAAVLTEISNGLVPANTGVILECNDTTSNKNRLLPLTDDIEVPAISGNCLKGYIELDGKTMNYDPDKMRVLNTTTTYGIGFYKMRSTDKDGNATTLASNKAYLDVSSLSGSAKSVVGFDFGGTTGIQNVEYAEPQSTRPVDDNYYDLMGRRVEQPTKGIYIHHGKKVVIR